jgi:hypothetical protein
VAQPPDIDATVRHIEALLEKPEEADPGELVRLLMRLYGAALERMVEMAGVEAFKRFQSDRLVASLLLLHGLHPETAEERVRQALDRVAGRMDCRIALEGVSKDAARIRVDRNGSGSPPGMLRGAIERALEESAPDLKTVEIAGLETAALVQIEAAPVR